MMDTRKRVGVLYFVHSFHWFHDWASLVIITWAPTKYQSQR
jgi:hypothetical protein